MEVWRLLFRGQQRKNGVYALKKVLLYCVFTIWALLGVSAAYLNGIPTAVTVPGALYVNYNVPAVGVLQNLSSATNNVTTLKIQQVYASATRVGVGQSFTVAYDITNTNPNAAVAGISPAINFFNPITDNASLKNAYFSTTPITALPITIGSGATSRVTFSVTVLANRPTGNTIVDGVIAGLSSNDQNWANAAISGGIYFTGAVTPSFVRELPATLNIASINVIAPAGATDRTMGVGQSFDVSFNVMNLGEAAVIGTRTVRVQLNGTNTDIAYIPGTVINQTLTAPLAAGTYIVTATIVAMGAPIDQSTGAAPAIQNGFVTLSITVQAPAVLDITGIDVPTAQVAPGQAGPVTIGVGVRNTGGATAQLNLLGSDLGFTTTGSITTLEFTIANPTTPVNLASGAQITVNYVVNTFGTTIGLCTVNATINGLDANTGAALITTPAATEMDTFFIRLSAPTLNISALSIVSPNGAIDTVLSSGQNFWISCNVQNLGQTVPGGTLQVQFTLPAGIVSTVGPITQAFTLGQPITLNLTAGVVGSGVVTVSILAGAIDPVTGLSVAYQTQTTTLGITVQAPALLDIVSMTIPTTSVDAFETALVTVSVQVKNIGSATAQLAVSPNTDLSFSLFPGTTILGAPPSASMLIGAGQTVTVQYPITRFGSGPGICTVNVTLNATDLNSSFNIVTASTTTPEIATYNVVFNAKIFVGAVSINPATVSANGSFQVYVPISGTGAGVSVSVAPALTDLLITAIPGGAPLTCNVVSVVPTPFGILGLQTVYVTYNVTILPAAVSGQYTVNLKNGSPAATDNISGLSASPPSGASATATLNYDNLAPVLSAVTPQIDVTPLLTRPTTNFTLVMDFGETINATSSPAMTFVLAGPQPIVGALSGTWATNIFTSNPLSLVTANEGFVTVSFVSGVTDLAGNAALASPNICRFYVDATAPTGTIAINGGQALTVNSVITITSGLIDNYPLFNTNNMFMMIVTPGSDVSTNPGITVNQWITYNQSVTLDLDILGGYTTKNITMLFRDEAGNISSPVTAAIYLDTSIITMVSPSIGAIISTNAVLIANTSAFVPSVSFYVSVNNTLTLLSVESTNNNGIFTFPWTTANIFCPTSTTNVEFFAVRHGATVATSNLMTGCIIDNVVPTVTITSPLALAYVANTITISAIATDNQLATSVNSVRIYAGVFGSPLTLVSSSVLDAVTVSYTLPVVPDLTTISIVVIASDAAGNSISSSTRNVIKYSAGPIINVLVPTPGVYVRQNFTLSGNVYTPLVLDMFTATTASVAIAATQSITATTTNWQVTINSAIASGLSLPITLNAYASGIVSTRTISYIVDEATPNITLNIPLIVNAIGTLTITGSITDALSGVSAVAVSVDGGTWIAVSPSFAYSLPITQATHLFTVAVSDNAWPVPNTYNITYTIIRDYTLLPTANFSNPVSGSYVNNTMSITVTASAWDGSPAQAVWVQFNDVGNNFPTWITANRIGPATSLTWNVTWVVPGSSNPAYHGTTYNAAIRVQAGAFTADVTAAPQAVYIQDVYGAAAVFTNSNEGKKVYFGTEPIDFLTGSLGAFVSRSYLVVDGTLLAATTLSATTPPTNNVRWTVNWNTDSFTGSVHVIGLRTIDMVGNVYDSPTIAVRTIPSTVVTERLPVSGVIDGSTIINNPIYATNQTEMRFANITTMNISEIRVNNITQPVSWNAANELVVVITANESLGAQIIAILEGSALSGVVTPHYQPIVYDITPPTVNVVINGVSRYYAGGYIAPNELFGINVVDSKVVTSSAFGSTLPSITLIGLSAAASYNYIVTPAAAVTASLVLRSLVAVGTTQSVPLIGDAYNPYTGIYSFRPNGDLTPGTSYSLDMYVVDNAGNTLNVTFNVGPLVVDQGADGESGGIDKDQFYTAYPNPYDPNDGDIKFTYYLKDNARKVRVFVYNEVGELLNITTIEGVAVEGTHAGFNMVSWNGKDIFRNKVANGIYMYMIVVEGQNGQSFVKGKLLVIRR